MDNNRLVASVSPITSGAQATDTFAATVQRVSNTGISFLVDAPAHESLEAHADLTVNLALPGRDRAYAIACIVHTRTAINGGFVYGCEFDWSATMDPLGVVEDLLEYTLDD